MNFDINNAFQYFDTAIIVIIAGGALSGFFKGLFKSTYNFVVFLALIITGWFLSPYLVKSIMEYDLSQIYAFEIKGVSITIINNIIPDLVDVFIPELAGLAAVGSGIYQLLHSLVFMVLRIIVMILWFLLMATIFRFIFYIIYRFIKPKAKTKDGKKIKPSILSRVSGMLIGTLHVLIVIALFSIPLSGLTSIGNSLVELLPDEEEDIIQEVAFSTDLSDYEEAFQFMEKYRETLSGKIGGFIPVKDSPLDEYLFDELLSLKINNDKIKLKSELVNILSAYNLINENIDGEINLDNILALDEELLETIIEDISKLKLAHVALPIAVEVFYKRDQIPNLDDEEFEEIYQGLLLLDFENEIQHFGSVFLNLVQLGVLNSDNSRDFYLNLDADKVDTLFLNLSKIEIIDLLSNYLINLLYTEKQSYFLDLGIDINTLNLKDIKWSQELLNLGSVYQAFQELGISFDGDTIVLSEFTDNAINSFSSAVFNSKLLSDNSDALSKITISLLPPEYKDILIIDNFKKEDLTSLLSLAKVLSDAGILIDELDIDILFSDENIEKIADAISNSELFSKNISGVLKILLEEAKLPFKVSDASLERDWTGNQGKAEITALFKAAHELFDLGLSGDNLLDNLDAARIESLTEKIIASEVLMGNIDNFLDFLFVENDSISTFKIDISSVSQLDWNSEEGKDEFQSIMDAIGIILETKLHKDLDWSLLGDGSIDINDDGIIDEADNTIGRLSESLSASILITNNLSHIITQLFSNQTTEINIIVFDDPDEWTKTEISSLFLSGKIIMGKEKFPEDLFLLDDTELDIILDSVLISKTIVSNLKELTSDDGKLSGLIIIDNVHDDDYYDQYDGSLRRDGESRRLFRSARIILGDNPDFDNTEDLISLNRILEIDDLDIEELTESIILRDSIANKLIEIGREGEELEVNLEMGDLLWADEIFNLIKATKTLLGDDAELDNFEIDINKINSLEDEDIDEVLNSIIIKDSLIMNLIKVGDTPESGLVIRFEKGDSAWNHELNAFLKAVNTLLDESSDLNDPDVIDINKITSLTEPDINKLASSWIIVDTAVKHIEDLTAPSGSLYELVYLPDINHDDYYGEGGEFKNFMLALNLLLQENTTDGNLDMLTSISISSLKNNQEEVLSSRILKETIIRNLEIESEKPGSVLKLSPKLNRNDDSWDQELPKFLDAIFIILGNDGQIDNVSISENVFLEIEKDDIEIITSSIVISYTAVKVIEEEGKNPSSLISLPDDLDPDSLEYQEEAWYGVEGELTKALKALNELKMTNFDDDIKINILFSEVKGETEEVILSSRLIETTIINKIKTEASPGGTLAGKLIIPEGTSWKKTLDDEGELRRFLKAIEIVIGPEGNFEDATFNVEKFFTDQEMLLASKVIEASVVNKIEEEADNEATLKGVLIIPEDTNWYGEDGELRHFLAGIEVILNGDSFEDATFNVEKFFTDQEMLLASKVIEASVVNKIEEEADNEATLKGVLIIPEDTNWYGEDGELRHFLAGIEVILAGDSFEDATFEVDKFIGKNKVNLDSLFASIVIEASAINFIKTSDKLIIPDEADTRYYYFETEDLIWEGLDGELRRFLDGIETILGDATFADFTFSMNNLLEVEFETALKSRVLEATLVDMVSLLIGETGVLAGLIDEPEYGYQWYYHPESNHETEEIGLIRRGEFDLNGNLQKSDLFGFLEAIKAMNNAGLAFDNINLNAIKQADPTTLASAFCDYSRIIGSSIANILNFALGEEIFSNDDINYTNKSSVISTLVWIQNL